MIIDQCIIDTIQSLRKPLVIGVSGFGGSGKTTFANLLGTTLHAPVNYLCCKAVYFKDTITFIIAIGL